MPHEILSPDEMAAFQARERLWVEAAAMNVRSATMFGETLTERDFIDRAHLTPAASQLLADHVAAQIEQTARALGYLK